MINWQQPQAPPGITVTVDRRDLVPFDPVGIARRQSTFDLEEFELPDLHDA
jgi:hypothetical protein